MNSSVSTTVTTTAGTAPITTTTAAANRVKMPSSAEGILKMLGRLFNCAEPELTNPDHRRALIDLFHGTNNSPPALTIVAGEISGHPGASLPPEMHRLAEVLLSQSPGLTVLLLAAALTCNAEPEVREELVGVLAEARLSAPGVVLGHAQERAFQRELCNLLTQDDLSMALKSHWVWLLDFNYQDPQDQLDRLPVQVTSSSPPSSSLSFMQDAMQVLPRSTRSLAVQEVNDKLPLELAKAIKSGGVPRIKELFQGSEEMLINAKLPPGGWTPLALAASLGDEQIVTFLLTCPGVDVNARCPGTSASQSQADEQRHKGDVSEATPLFLAARNGHGKVVGLLLKNPAVEVAAVNASAVSPFFMALANDHRSVVTEFLNAEDRIDLNKQNRQHQTPLCFAVESGNIPVIRMLLGDSRVRTGVLGKNNATALHLAVARPDPEVFELFAELCPDEMVRMANARDEWGITPLEVAARCGADLERVLKPLQELTRMNPARHLPKCIDGMGLVVRGPGVRSPAPHLLEDATAFGVQLLQCGNGIQNMSLQELQSFGEENMAFALVTGEATWDGTLNCHKMILGGGEGVPTSVIIRNLAEMGVRDITFFVKNGSMAVDGLARQLNSDPVWLDSVHPGLKITFVDGDAWYPSESSDFDMQNRVEDFAVIANQTAGDSMQRKTVHVIATLSRSETGVSLVAEVSHPPVDRSRAAISQGDNEKILYHQLLQQIYQGKVVQTAGMLGISEAWKYQDRLKGSVLVAAAAGGHLDTVSSLLQGSGIEINNSQGVTAMYAAARCNHPAIVDLLVKYPGVDVNACLPLHVAAQAGHAEVVSVLLQHPDIDINRRSHDGSSPLQSAAENGHVEVVACLLQHPGVDVNATNSKGASPLDLAAKNGHGKVVRLLLVDPSRLSCDVTVPMMIAAKNEHSDIAKMLEDLLAESHLTKVAAEKEVQQKAKKFFEAADDGYTPKMKKLLNQPGIQINRAELDGLTPLTITAQNGREKAVKMLLNVRGILVNRTDSRGATPLFLAAQEGHVEVARMLVSCPGILVNLAESEGSTPLLIAIRMGKPEVFGVLLKLPEIDVCKADNQGATPLHAAAQWGRKEMFEVLVKHPKINVNVQDLNGATPLFVAASHGHHEIVRLLLANLNVKVGAVHVSGASPFFGAVANDHALAVRAFLDCPARIDMNEIDKNGQTALCLATKKGALAALTVLLDDSRVNASKCGVGSVPPLQLAACHTNPKVFQAFVVHRFREMRLLADFPNRWGATPLAMAIQWGGDQNRVIKLGDLTSVQRVQPLPLTAPSFKEGLLIVGSGFQPPMADLDRAAGKGGIVLEHLGNGEQELSWDDLLNLPEQQRGFAMVECHGNWDDTLQCHMTCLGEKDVVPTVEIIRVLAEKGVKSITFFVCYGGKNVGDIARRMNNDPAWPMHLNLGLRIVFVGGDASIATGSCRYDMLNLVEEIAVSNSGQPASSSMYMKSVSCLDTVIWSHQSQTMEVAHFAPIPRGSRGILTPLDEQTIQGNELLKYAASGQLEALDNMLVNPQVNVNFLDLCGASALAMAASRGQTAAMVRLLQQTQINVNSDHSAPALYHAARWGHSSMVELLMKCPGIRVNDFYPLAIATQEGCRAVVEVLLQHPDIDPNGNGCATPILVAAERGDERTVALLLQHPQVDINLQILNGVTPLFAAAMWGHEKVVRLLLNHQIRLLTSFDAEIDVARQNNFPVIVKMLEMAREVGRKSMEAVRVEDLEAAQSLLKAAVEGDLATLKLKLQHPGIQINKSDVNGQTPLAAAARAGHHDAVRLLLNQKGIVINRPDSMGLTPLHLAVGNGHSPVVDLLVAKRGILINAVNQDGKTALEMAAHLNKLEVASILLENGASALRPALKIAQDNRHWDMVDLLTAALNARERPAIPDA